MQAQPDRAYGLDFVRGCCAVLVVCYHLFIWKAHHEFYAWGLYGVYIFFVLSGASLTLTYKEKLDAGYPLTDFLLLRLARLGPLFGLVSAIMLVYSAHTNSSFSHWLSSGIVSSSLMFGLGNPGTNSLVLGGWSLGIELVFYLMFPFMLAFAFSRYWLAVALLLALVQASFIHLVFHQRPDFRAAWDLYTQPLAFVAYFFAGCVIGRSMLSKVAPPAWASAALAAASAAGILFLSGPTAVDTLTGWRGALLMVMAVALVFAAAQYRPRTSWQRALCIWAGEISYGTYLLHPLMYTAFQKVLPSIGFLPTLLLTLASTLVAAWLIEKYFEWPMRLAAKKWVDQSLLKNSFQ